MAFSFTLQIPHVYYEHKHRVFDCLDMHICSYINAFNLPYYWMSSDGWRFYYASLDMFSPYLKSLNGLDPFLANFLQVYNVPVTDRSGESFRNAVTEAVRNGRCLLVRLDGFYLPWNPTYMKIHRDHYLLLTDYDPAAETVYVNDLYPNEHKEWATFHIVESAVTSSEGRYYELGEPSLQFSRTLLERQLNRCVQNLAGEPLDRCCTGLPAIRKFRHEIVANGQSNMQYVDLWWDHLLPKVIRRKEMFINFLQYVKEETGFFDADQGFRDMIRDFKHTVNTWFAFRNGVMKSKMTGVFDVESAARRLDRLYELEEVCLRHLEERMA